MTLAEGSVVAITRRCDSILGGRKPARRRHPDAAIRCAFIHTRADHVLTLTDHPELEKNTLIGGCVRLSVGCDVDRLRAEVVSLPAHFWGAGGRLGPQLAAQSVFLRGYAPMQGKLPIEDREALAHLPYVREIITALIPAPPLRCLLASLPPGEVVLPHTDKGNYFIRTIRLHIPVITSDNVWMFCAGRSYQMLPGEIWVLNNSTEHAVWNADPELARVHLICDFLSSPGLLAMLASSQRDLGVINAAVHERLFDAPPVE
jgi:hypothetical protein